MVSAANVAGFNNKAAALAAALIACLALLARLQWPAPDIPSHSARPRTQLSRSLIVAVVLVYTGSLAVLAHYFAGVPIREILDAGYFLHQLNDHVSFGRKLYAQIEFPYGPLLFYVPVLVRTLLSPLHVSLAGSYYFTVIAEHILGLLLLAYILDIFPLSARWKGLLFVLISLGSYNFDFGLNYTLFRFTAAPAALIVASRARSVPSGILLLFLGETLSVSVSPEMGFAFAAGAAVFSAYRAFQGERLWLAGIVSPFLAASLFLWLNSDGYLRMLGMFAKGVFNFIVEPQPNILIFLVALVWFTPIALAPLLRAHDRLSALFAGLFFYTLALLPVAFGRADGGHVLLNCYLVFAFAAVALNRSTQAAQLSAALVLTAGILWPLPMSARFYRDPMRAHLHASLYYHSDWLLSRATLAMLKPRHPGLAAHMEELPKEPTISYDELSRLTGQQPVMTPLYVPINMEQHLQATHQYVPTFYFFGPVLDLASENRQIASMRQVPWTLFPDDTIWTYTETPEMIHKILGIDFHYRSKRRPWIAGQLLKQELDRNWTETAHLGGYILYHQNGWPLPLHPVS